MPLGRRQDRKLKKDGNMRQEKKNGGRENLDIQKLFFKKTNFEQGANDMSWSCRWLRRTENEEAHYHWMKTEHHQRPQLHHQQLHRFPGPRRDLEERENIP